MVKPAQPTGFTNKIIPFFFCHRRAYTSLSSCRNGLAACLAFSVSVGITIENLSESDGTTPGLSDPLSSARSAAICSASMYFVLIKSVLSYVDECDLSGWRLCFYNARQRAHVLKVYDSSGVFH